MISKSTYCVREGEKGPDIRVCEEWGLEVLLSVSSPEAPYLDGGQERSGAVSSPTKRPDPGREGGVNVVGKNVR